MDLLRYVSRYLLIFSALCAAPLQALAAGGSTPYFEIPTPFVVNLADKGSLAYLQVNAQLKITRPELKTVLNAHMPAIQHTMMMLLSEQSAQDINNVQGKQALRERTLKEVQGLLQAQIGEPAVEEVYFTSFIVQ